MHEMRTDIASTTVSDILIRGRNLVDLMGRLSYTDMLVLTALGRVPSPVERTIIDAIAVSVMDHGLTPSSLAARLTLLGAPESFQAAVAAGLAGAGSTYLGGMTEVTEMLRASADGLDEEASDHDVQSAAEQLVEKQLSAGRKLPGVGHNIHSDGDPRVARLRTLVSDAGLYDVHWRILDAIPEALAAVKGRSLPLNNVGAIGASVAALGLPAEMGRGIALAARAGGLIAHLLEEKERPLAKQAWEYILAAAEAAPHETEGAGHG